jgi:hypothetical protein
MYVISKRYQRILDGDHRDLRLLILLLICTICFFTMQCYGVHVCYVVLLMVIQVKLFCSVNSN